MKAFLVLTFVSLFAVHAGAASCSDKNKLIQADLDALGNLMDSGGKLLKTKSNKPLEMVKEYIDSEYDGDSDSYEYKSNVTSITTDASEAGTATTKAAMTAIMDTAETWYVTADGSLSKEEEDANRSKIRAAAVKLLRHRLKFGYDASAQGWGGSPANNLLMIDTKCKVVHSFFLGISHD